MMNKLGVSFSDGPEVEVANEKPSDKTDAGGADANGDLAASASKLPKWWPVGRQMRASRTRMSRSWKSPKMYNGASNV